MEHEFEIIRVSEYSQKVSDAIKRLAKQIGENYQDLTDEDVKEMIASPMHNLFVAQSKDDCRDDSLTCL
jgi:hypothetical protein